MVHEWAETAHDRGIKVIIAAAGKAAHLGGVVAAFTPLPVIAVPMKTSDLGGLDSLLSMVQMPSGVPVACVAINGAKNAAILAVQMMGANDEAMLQKVVDLKAEMAPRRSRLVMGAVCATQFARRFAWQRRPCSWLQAIRSPIFSQKLRFVSIRSGAAGNLRGENDVNEGKWSNFGAENGHEARSSVSNVCRKC